ncbi:MAG: OmpA family protein [Verrucomicrobiae bacterium]|nr:OmpA family protein [Verrucomicrobiae bacterium]
MFSLFQAICGSRQIRTLSLALVALGSFALPRAYGGNSGIIPLKVRFWADEIELTGAVPDQKTANRVIIAIHQVCPGTPVRDRLIINPLRTVVGLPESKDLAGLLLEMALSTKDGSLIVTNSSVVVSGLSDSLVTHAAFEARLSQLAARHPSKVWENRICLVPDEDLRPSRLPRRPRPALNPAPLERAPFVLSENEYGPMPELRALPLASISLEAEKLVEAKTTEVLIPDSAEAPPEPDIALEAAEQIRFSTNSFLVGFDQYEKVDAAKSRIRDLPESAGKVVIRAYPDTAGRHAYNDWLSQTRAKAILRKLIEAGLAPDRIRIELLDGVRDSDKLGTVGIYLPKVLPPVSAGDLLDSPPPSEGPPEEPVSTVTAASILPVAEALPVR